MLGDIYLYLLIQILLFMGYTKEECYEIAKSLTENENYLNSLIENEIEKNTLA